MLKVTIAQAKDIQNWDAYVSSHPDAWPYHLYAWKKAIKKAYGHKGYYLMAQEEGQITGVLPLIHLQFSRLVNELTALPYCDVGSILCNDEQSGRALLEAAVRIGEKLGVDTIQLRGEYPWPEASNTPTPVREENNKVRMFLALPADSEELMRGFKSKLRSQIRKSVKNGLQFHWGSIDNINEYYSVFSGNMRDLGSPVHSRRLFKAILEYYGDAAGLGIVTIKNKCIGGGIILSMTDRVSIPWASTLRRYNRLAPNMLLYWNFLKYSADSGFSLFDFGRSSPDGGTYRFKYQWGARPIPLDWYTFYIAKRKVRKSRAQSSSLRENFERIWQRLPLPAANFFGPLIRKHISL